MEWVLFFKSTDLDYGDNIKRIAATYSSVIRLYPSVHWVHWDIIWLYYSEINMYWKH